MLRNKIVQVVIFFIALLLMTGALLSHVFFQKIVRVDPKMVKSCAEPKNIQTVAIDDQGFTPKKITAQVCDRIMFENTGKRYHEPAFGPHPNHLLYPGFSEKVLAPGQKETLLLKAFGTFELHNHLNEELEAELVVNEF